MIIKKAEKEDICALGEFYDAEVKFLTEHINYPHWTYKGYPTLSTVEWTVGEGTQFICCENDEILGAFVLNTDPMGDYNSAEWSKDLKEGEYMVCHMLATVHTAAGKGIGRAMTQFCIDHAKKNGFKAIRLDVVPDNFPARRLYEKCGFEYSGEADLKRNVDTIPLFSLYEYNF